MQTSRIAGLAVIAALSLAACGTREGPRLSQQPLAIEAEIDDFVEQALDELQAVPGLSLAIYSSDGVYARGFGIADVETGESVSPETAFYIASSTKSFTALAMNILHHRGEIDLDATLAEFAPDAMFPPEAGADRVSLRDLITHTSGVSNGPLTFRHAWSGQHTPETDWSLLGSTTPDDRTALGEFRYTNAGYNILTVLSDQVLGIDWQDLLDKELVGPVGLTRTTASMSKAESMHWSVARPHLIDLAIMSRNGTATGNPVRIGLEKTDSTMHSAGGLLMSANDAVRWLELLVEDGRVRGEQIVPAQVIRETREPMVEVGAEFGPYRRDSYGLGWYIGPYHGDTLVHHFGSYTGSRAHVSYMPERKVGVAAFVNDSTVGFTLPDIVANLVYDRLAGRPDALATAQREVAQLRSQLDSLHEQAPADQRDGSLALPLEAYVGRYENSLYGEMDVSQRGGALTVALGNLTSVARPAGEPDTILVELVGLRQSSLRFHLDAHGRVAAIVDEGGTRYARR